MKFRLKSTEVFLMKTEVVRLEQGEGWSATHTHTLIDLTYHRQWKVPLKDGKLFNSTNSHFDVNTQGHYLSAMAKLTNTESKSQILLRKLSLNLIRFKKVGSENPAFVNVIFVHTVHETPWQGSFTEGPRNSQKARNTLQVVNPVQSFTRSGDESARLDVGVDKLSSVGVDTLFQVALQLVFFNHFTIIG